MSLFGSCLSSAYSQLNNNNIDNPYNSTTMSRVSGLLNFLNSSPSPHHAVESMKSALLKAGFVQLFENESWDSQIKTSGKYFITRNGTSLIALAVENGFVFHIFMIAAHTDSPCLRIKPISKKAPKEGFLQVGVETYGGGLWHTWFDRDLSIAGKFIVNEGTIKNPSLKEHLVDVKKSILHIPSLAIHLDRTVNECFKFNTETNLTPIMCSSSKKNSTANESTESNFSHHKELLDAICAESQKSPNQVVSVDLCLYDVQPAALIGSRDEFISSSRLDNLYMSYCTIESLIESVNLNLNGNGIRVAILFDHEEIGSQSPQGADSNIIETILKRFIASFEKKDLSPDTFVRLITRSLLISADMAHAVHPNYSDKHDECHRPRMQNGLVIKYNSNQRYATSARTAAFIKALSQRNDIPVQEFMVKNDSPCGSTIGPILSAKLGVSTVDVGVAQLSMHSIREIAGSDDVDNSVNLFSAFYTQYPVEINFHNP